MEERVDETTHNLGGEMSTEQKRFEYQPVDEHGRPIGGKQVILYTTEDEKFEKMVTMNQQLIRQLRKVTRDNRLGINQPESIAENSEKAPTLLDFKGRSLTAQERFDLSQKLNDPEHADEAIQMLFESAVGATPAQLREFLSDTQMAQLQQKAADQYLAFAQTATQQFGYYDCVENRETIADWVFKNGLAPSAANFFQAYSKLSESGLILGAPVAAQPTTVEPTVTTSNGSEIDTATGRVDLALNPEAQTQPPAAPVTRIGNTPQQPQPRQSHVPSGLNERTSSTSGQAPAVVSGATRQDGTTLTLKEINRMPPDELRNRMRDPQFVALVEKLETADKARKAALGMSKF
jgi:hypothetical protein